MWCANCRKEEYTADLAQRKYRPTESRWGGLGHEGFQIVQCLVGAMAAVSAFENDSTQG